MSASSTNSRIPVGWYVDPDDAGRLRYFDVDGWTSWISTHQRVTRTPLTNLDTAPPSAVAVTREILRRAHSEDVIDSRTLSILTEYTKRWDSPAPPAATPAQTAPGPAQVGKPKPTPSGNETPATPSPVWAAGTTQPAAVPAGSHPSPVSRWWSETRRTVTSDLAVHGLAYLGILLLFAGVFGFVVWSFADLEPTMRPIAELAIPAALFGAAVMLNRRGTEVVAGALEATGGLLLPIVAVASFVDGAPVPPDPSGVSLAVALAVTTLVVAIGYAGWVRLHPSSKLAYLVAPVGWLAFGLLSLAWLDPVPSGQAVAEPRAIETAVMAVAAGCTLLALRLKPRLPLADATFSSGPIALAVLAMLALLAGSADGWPPTAGVISAIGITLGLEALSHRLPGSALTKLTSISVGLGLLAAGNGLDSSPWVTVLAFAAATGWAEYHRRQTGGAERQLFSISAGLFPAGVVMGVVAALGWPNGLVLSAMLLAVFTIVLRVRGTQDLTFSTWSTAASAGLAIGLALASGAQVIWPGSADPAELEGSWQAPLVALLLAGAIGVGRTNHPVLVTWAVVAVGAETWAYTIPALDAAHHLVATGWVVGAAAVVVAVAAMPGRWRGRAAAPILGHLTLSSLTLGVLGSAVAWADSPWSSARMGLVAGATALAWLIVSVVDELRGSEAVAVARQWFTGASEDFIHFTPAALGVVAATASIVFTVDATNPIIEDSWWLVVGGVTALVYVVLARLTVGGLPRQSRVAYEAALVLAGASLASGIFRIDNVVNDVPLATTFVLVIAVAMVVPKLIRDSRPAWLGWAASAPLSVVLVDRVSTDGDHGPMTLMVWGSITTLAALCVEWLPAAAGLKPVVSRTLPPRALGVIGLVLGAITVFVDEDFETTGWWFLLVTATAALAGVLVRDGRLLGLAAATATVSYAALAPWEPLVRPWTLVAVGGVWLAASDIASRRPNRRLSPSLFLVGHLVVITALPWVLIQNQRPLGLFFTGLVAIGVAVRIPNTNWRPWYGVIGVALVFVGAADESLGWLTVAWLLLSVGATAAAAIGRGISARATGLLRHLGAVAALAAWVTAAGWADLSTETTVAVTALGAGLLLAALGATVRLVSVAKVWVEAWGAVDLAAVILAAAGLALPGVARTPAGQMVSAGLVLAAIAAAVAAVPLQRGGLRTTAVLLGAAAAAAFLYGVDAQAPQVTAVAVAAAVAATIGVAATASGEWGAEWRRALLVGATLTGGAALASAATVLPDTALLVGALVVVAAECMVIGYVVGVTALLVAGPPLLSFSWMLYASEALSGNPQWYLVPLGLALVAMAGLLRWTARKREREVATIDIVILELTGVALIAGTAIVQTATDSLGYALVAVVEGITIALWGAATKVRRRLAAGVGVVVIAVVLLVTVPLLKLIPEWRGAALWVGVAGLGLAAIVIATFIERGRAKVGAWVKSLSETMVDWE